MKFRLVGLAVLMVGCAGRRPAEIPQPSPVDTSGILRLVGRFNLCHACPISEHDALTAAHCVDPRPLEGSVPLFPMAWEDLVGNNGILSPVGVEKERDLGQVYSAKPFAKFYERATEAPKVGDEVVVLGYKWERKNPWGTKEFRARVTGVVAGHFTMDENPDSGSSGGCVLDAKTGKLLGIEYWKMQFFGGDASAAVGVWGDWLKELITVAPIP